MLFSCQTPTKISEQEVRETFNEFFDIVDNNIENFGSIITDDFYIFENSRKYTADEFIEFVESKVWFQNLLLNNLINTIKY